MFMHGLCIKLSCGSDVLYAT